VNDRLSVMLKRAVMGETVAIAQLISALEARVAGSDEIRPELYEAGGHAHVIGITGTPGAGKSSLVNALVAEIRRRGKRVAVVAVDPSSPYSGGAILGDRIRIHTPLDPGVFVRSMGTRGWLGGVSRATIDAVAVLDAAGFDAVIVETIGVGQDELEIVRIAQTTVIVSVPGLGDEIQAMKAGLLEIADIHVVNKADRPEADRTAAELCERIASSGVRNGNGWQVPVLSTIALDGSGVSALVDAIEEHLGWLHRSHEMDRRQRESAAARIRAIAKELLVARLEDPSNGVAFDEVVDLVTARRLDPETAARRLLWPKTNVVG
jgi:LAO/AO transport system kinase